MQNVLANGLNRSEMRLENWLCIYCERGHLKQIDLMDENTKPANDYHYHYTLETDTSAEPSLWTVTSFQIDWEKCTFYLNFIAKNLLHSNLFSLLCPFINSKQDKKSIRSFFSFHRKWQSKWVTIKKSFKFLNHEGGEVFFFSKKKNLQVELNIMAKIAPFLRREIFWIFSFAFTIELHLAFGYNVYWRAIRYGRCVFFSFYFFANLSVSL